MKEELPEEKITSPLLGLSDEHLLRVSSTLKETPLEEFLNSYEEAQKIAKEIMDGRDVIGRKELEDKAIKIIRERASESEVSLEGLEKSLGEGTLSEDFPSCKDFIDFVISAIEETGGKITEGNPAPKNEAGPIWTEPDFIDLKEGRNLKDEDLFLVDTLAQLPKEIALEHHNYYSLNGERCLEKLSKDIFMASERMEKTIDVENREKLQSLITYLETQKKIVEKYDWQTAWNINIVLERRKKPENKSSKNE